MSEAFLHTFSVMGTVVTIEVVGHGETADRRRERKEVVERAAAWFDDVERCCSRFDPTSELSRLSDQVGTPIHASPMLLECVTFALAVAEETGGAFDPSIGQRMEELGFDREYRSGQRLRPSTTASEPASYRDVHVDARAATITIDRPLRLDLGAVAKGLAIDMAARELAPLANYAVNAGGDLYLGGVNGAGEAWSVGIRHPRDAAAVIETLHLSDRAVCTSGDYERVSPIDDQSHHIVDPRSGRSSAVAASVTVVADSAMVADALSTAAFVLGPQHGIDLLERHGVEGFMMTTTLDRFDTRGMAGVSER